MGCPGYWPKATINKVVIKGIKKSKKRSTERRVLKAVLHESYTREELNGIVNEHEYVMEGFHVCADDKESERNITTSADGGSVTVDIAVGNDENNSAGHEDVGTNIRNGTTGGGIFSTVIRQAWKAIDGNDGSLTDSSDAEAQLRGDNRMDGDNDLGGEIVHDLFDMPDIYNVGEHDISEFLSDQDAKNVRIERASTEKVGHELYHGIDNDDNGNVVIEFNTA